MGGDGFHWRRPGLISAFFFICFFVFSLHGSRLVAILFVSSGLSSVSSPVTVGYSPRPSGAGRSSVNVTPASNSVSEHVSQFQIPLDLGTDLPIFSSYLSAFMGSLSRTRSSIERRSVAPRTLSFVSLPRSGPKVHVLLIFKPRSESFTRNLLHSEPFHDMYPQAFQGSYPPYHVMMNQPSKLHSSVSKQTWNLRRSPRNRDDSNCLCSSPRDRYKFLTPTVLNLFNKLFLWNVGQRLHEIAGLPDSVGLVTSSLGLRYWQKAPILDRVSYRHRAASVIGYGAMSKHTNSVSYGKKMAPALPPDKLPMSFSVSGVGLLSFKAMKIFSSRTHLVVFCVQWHFIHAASLLKLDRFIVLHSPELFWIFVDGQATSLLRHKLGRTHCICLGLNWISFHFPAREPKSPIPEPNFTLKEGLKAIVIGVGFYVMGNINYLGCSYPFRHNELEGLVVFIIIWLSFFVIVV